MDVLDPSNNFDYDLTIGLMEVPNTSLTNGISNQIPQFANSSRSGNYQLLAGSPGHDAGTVLPNFNDGFEGTAPDMGAHERGGSIMLFGIDAWLLKKARF